MKVTDNLFDRNRPVLTRLTLIPLKTMAIFLGLIITKTFPIIRCCTGLTFFKKTRTIDLPFKRCLLAQNRRCASRIAFATAYYLAIPNRNLEFLLINVLFLFFTMSENVNSFTKPTKRTLSTRGQHADRYKHSNRPV